MKQFEPGHRIDRRTQLVLLAYAVLALAPLVFAATHAWFWDQEHSSAPIAVGAFALLLAALLLKQRWAWLLLAVFQAAVLVSFAFDFTTVPALLLNAASLALLLSAPMRGYIRAEPGTPEA